MGKFNFDQMVSRAHLRASGWSLGAWEESNPFETHCFYLCDYRFDGAPLLVTVTQASFNELPSAPFTAEALSSEVLQRAAKLRRQPGSASLASKAALALCLYAKKTRSYKAWVDSDPSDATRRLHMVLNLYPDGDGAGIVRPFVGTARDTLLSAEQIAAASFSVMEQDILNGLCPEPGMAGAEGVSPVYR